MSGIFIAGDGYEQSDDAVIRTQRLAARRLLIEQSSAVLLATSEDTQPVGAYDAMYALSRGVPVAVWLQPGRPYHPGGGMAALAAMTVIIGAEDQALAIELTATVIEHTPKEEPILLYGTAATANLLRRCESPAEKRLAVHLLSVLACRADLVGQLPVTAGGSNYRLDFAVAPESHKVAIEVDGHDFHERTKEQAARDKARDRALQADGWKVLRFTGSEVWNDPHRCALEVRQLVAGLDGGAAQ